MEIIHQKACEVSEKFWEQIRTLNQKIIPSSLYDQSLYAGGCLQLTCDNAIAKAQQTSSAEVLLCRIDEQFIGYMIFYCDENPPSIQPRLDKYSHLGRVGYSDMLVVDPAFQRLGYSKKIRACMKEIGRNAKIDVFMTFVRSLPIPNLSSFIALRQAGAVSGRNFLLTERNLTNFDGLIQDLCLELLYPTDERKLTSNELGLIHWV
ncbi:MAG: GNAT family N-acetyltransferase [Tatlockia sp.]|nr:GNAT family N-acetyltransferase [Tatlockia sp.]